MKGLVFREFLTMVENEYGYETVDSIIEKSKVHSKGIYTRVGTYPHSEMFALVAELSSKVNVPVNQLLFLFGKYVFKVFKKGYPMFFDGKKSSFELFADVEDIIHIEVLKLYPDAELPSFEVKKVSKSEMTMLYHSQRKLSDFAAGLIEACMQDFNEEAKVERENVEEDGSVVLFRIQKLHE